MLTACAGTIVGGAALLWLGPDALALAGLVLIGVGCAPVYPSLMAATPARVGSGHAASAIGLQVCGATIGASALPALIGVLVARAGPEVLGPALVAAAVLLLVLGDRILGPDEGQSSADQ